VQRYLVKEVQKVYRSQGVTINDKHIESSSPDAPQGRIDQPGDTDLLPTELIDRLDFERVSNRVLAEAASRPRRRSSCWASPRPRSTPQLPGRGLVPGDDPGSHRAAINGSKDH